MHLRRAWAFTLVAVAVLGTAFSAQRSRPQPPAARSARQVGAVSVEAATLLTNGWALLTEGRGLQAAAKADQALAASPRDAAALVLAIESDVATGGAAGGLDRYERWLQRRTIEEPGILRRLAVALLREEAAQGQDLPARAEALLALADDGDPKALADLEHAPGGAARTRARASSGDPRSVRELIAQLNRGSADTVRIIDALGESRNPSAVAPIADYLADPRQEVRGAAVDALGKLGDRTAVGRVAPLLSDRIAYVRIRAAGALLRLGDNRGVPLLQQLMSDESPAMRLAAAEAMSSRPDASWLALVRQLTSEPDPEVRVGAARLVASQDPDLARAVLEPLTADANPAVRDIASYAIGDVPGDLTTLRRLLRNPQRLARVRAAGRVLAMTR